MPTKIERKLTGVTFTGTEEGFTVDKHYEDVIVKYPSKWLKFWRVATLIILCCLATFSLIIIMCLLEKYILSFKIPEFGKGWISCMGCYLVIIFYKKH